MVPGAKNTVIHGDAHEFYGLLGTIDGYGDSSYGQEVPSTLQIGDLP